MEGLSKRQREVLDFIINKISNHNIPPTYREIGEALGIKSTNGVSDHIRMLIKKRYIERSSEGRGLARGLLLTEKANVRMEEEIVSVPILGNVAAGLPMLADEHCDQVLKLDQSLTQGLNQVFALRVKGESMINEGILENDLVIVRKQSTANDGDIVVAMVDGEATVKTFFREKDRIRLQPANDTMRPIYVDSSQNAAIRGRVISVIRTY